MTAATSLLDFILNLLKDPQAQEQFRASPEQVLAANGLTGVSAADIRETVPLVTDNRFVELNSSNHIVSPSVVSPAGDNGIHAAIHYLHHIIRTYRYDDHGTHAHDPGHGNIWAVGDATHTFDDGHVAAGGAAPGPGDVPGTSHWMGGGHENFTHEHSGHDSKFIYGDHIHGLSYGDTQDDPAGSWSGNAFRHPGHDHGQGLHSFGSGAAMTLAGGTGSPAGYSGDIAGSHDSTGFSHANSGMSASQAGPDDFHTHDAYGSYGDAYYGHDSYYGQDTEHSSHDPPEPHIYLDLH
jgi:hypothetical protein